MKKEKKTDLKKVVKKAEIETGKNRVPGLQEHITKPIVKPKNKRKKSKEKIDDGKKQAGQKPVGKAAGKQKPRTDNKANKKQGSGKGEKTPVQRTPVKRDKSGILDKILPPWF